MRDILDSEDMFAPRGYDNSRGPALPSDRDASHPGHQHLHVAPYPVIPGVLRGPDEYAMPSGHRPGGDPVQKHSAGDLYPYVIVVVETDADRSTRRYEVLGPKLGSGYWWGSPEDAENAARQLKRAWECRPRPVRTLGDYLANKYDIHDGSEL